MILIFAITLFLHNGEIIHTDKVAYNHKIKLFKNLSDCNKFAHDQEIRLNNVLVDHKYFDKITIICKKVSKKSYFNKKR